MGHSFLLTAGLILGQAQTAQVAQPTQGQCGCESSAQQGVWARSRTWSYGSSSSWQSSPSSTWSEDRTIFSRIQSFFRGDQGQTNWSSGARTYGGHQTVPVYNEIYTPTNSTMPPPEFMHRMPSKVSMSEPPLLDTPKSGIQPASFEPKAAQAPSTGGSTFKPSNGAKPKAAPSTMAHEENYAWINGRIAFDNGILVVHYAAPGAGDRFGGRVVLTGDHDFSTYGEGDLVTVRGQLIAGQSGMNFYRVTTIEKISQAR